MYVAFPTLFLDLPFEQEDLALQVLVGKLWAGGDDQVQLVLVEPRLLQVDVGSDLGHALGEKVSFEDSELAPENGLRGREVRAKELI